MPQRGSSVPASARDDGATGVDDCLLFDKGKELESNSNVLKQNAAIKSTSGEGFSFEDKTVAFFLGQLLIGTLPFGVELGRLQRLDCQVRSQGWELDDLLMTCSANGQTSRCAFSIKSNRQFTTGGAPANLVHAAWAQLLHTRSNVFDSNRDFIGIITAIHPPKTRENLNELLKLARGQDPTELNTHVATGGSVSASALRMYDSFRCPSEWAKPREVLLPGMLLRRFLFREFDFAETTSERESAALSLCEQALLGPDLDTARSLWEALLALANKIRTQGGYIDLPRLLAGLRNRFALRDHPDFETDWRSMHERTRRYLEMLEAKLGGTFHVSRHAELEQLSEKVGEHGIILVRGPSGSGKSALVKSWLEGQTECKVLALWVRGEDLQRHSDKPLMETLGLRWPLDQFLASSTATSSILVIDGLEGCYSREGYQSVKDLIAACSLESGMSPWRVVLTCQTEEWPRVQLNLLRFVNAGFAKLLVVAVENFSPDQFAQVVDAFPSIRPLVWRKEITRLLLRPKVLDLLVTQIQARATPVETTEWVGEADLIGWWWTDVVEESQPASDRSRVVRLLAERLSDKLETELSMDEFRGDERLCSALARQGILSLTEGRLRFAHDLFADWARQRHLLAQASNLKAYLEPRLDNPLWQKALRLLGLHLVERTDDLNDWRRLLAEFADTGHTSQLARDLLLEAVIFASDPGPLLEKLWPELAAKQGELLGRFLRRFLHSATIPDFRSVEFFQKEEPDFVTEIAARQRLPYVPYWFPILNWLSAHTDEVIAFSGKEIAHVAKLWLTVADGKLLDRGPTAELAVRNAERIVPLEFVRDRHLDDDAAKAIYEAALAAAGDLPERVVKLTLTLAGRRSLEKDEMPPDADAELLGQESALSGEVIHSELAEDPPQPWPDGPQRPVSRAFQETFLQGGPAVPLIVHQPSAAAEATLALLISWPRTRIIRRRRGPSTLADKYGFQFRHPDDSFYTSGPFLLFFRQQPEHAVSMVLRLVNFATARCIDAFFCGNEANASVRIPFEAGERIWIGDWRVFYWFRYPLITAHVVGAALMALEKWLYECLDAGRPVHNVIEAILAGAKSVAFAGVLVCVGKRHPDLLTGPLRDLLAVREFHLWEAVESMQYRNITATGFGFGDARIRRRLKLEWEQMPHREIGLHDLCCQLFLTKAGTRAVFERIRLIWKARSSEATPFSEEALSWLRWAAKFDPENYSKKTSDGRILWEFALPENLRDKHAEEQAHGEQVAMQLPLWSRTLVDREQALPEAQLEDVWRILQEVAARPLPDEDEEEPRSQFLHPLHSVAGLIAVLVVLHRAWLRQHPEREKWCREKLEAILRGPPQMVSFDPYEPVDCQFDGFAAQVVPIYWADDPNSAVWREHVVSLALCPRLRTVALLCRAAAANASQLGEAFRDLQTFLLHMSVARLKDRRQRYCDKKAFDWQGWIKDWRSKFVSRALPPLPKSWQDIAVPEDIRRHRRGPGNRDVPRRDFDLDLDFLLCAFSWLGPVEQTAPGTERADWIQFEREVLSCVLRTFPAEIGDAHEYDGTPYETDRHVFQRVTATLLRLRPDEGPAEFWQPILELGPAAHYWVSDFLNSFLTAGLQQSPVSHAFIRTWKSMLQFAFASPKWSGTRRFHSGEIWQHLLGQDWVIRSLWVKEHEPLLIEVKAYFERWAKEQLHHCRELRTFFHFLETEAASCLVCDGLAWATPLLRGADKWFWQYEDDRDAFASFLRLIWEKHWTTVRRNSVAVEGFKTLAAKLAAYQNPLALEISTRVASGT